MGSNFKVFIHYHIGTTNIASVVVDIPSRRAKLVYLVGPNGDLLPPEVNPTVETKKDPKIGLWVFARAKELAVATLNAELSE